MGSDACSTATVESRLPGRIRLRVPREHRDESFLSLLESVLRSVEGVLNVEENTLTGSVLVEYDQDRASGESVVDACRCAGVVGDRLGPSWPCDTDWPGRSRTADGIVRSFRRFDSTVCRVTRGVIDAKMAVSLLLLAKSVSRMLANSKPGPVPWHSLLWYSYSVFMHWHRPGRNGGGSG
jgi:hypothetical protein